VLTRSPLTDDVPLAFRLGQCTLALTIEPLAGALAHLDRQLAWRCYLALVTRPALRNDTRSRDALEELITALGIILAEWPAGQVDAPRQGHLGYLLVTVIEAVLVPCLHHEDAGPASWHAVRGFCQALARELAREYGFPDAGANIPADLLAAWRDAR
jgi:hypothetical protein